MNNRISEKDLIRIKGEFQSKYGIEMDDWSAMLMADSQERFQAMNLKLDVATKEIQEASQKVKGSIKTFTFGKPSEVFRFGIAVSIIPSITVLILGFLLYYYFANKQEYKDIVEVIEHYPNASDYRILMQNAEVITKGTAKYIILKPSNERARVGENYQRKRGEKDIIIPLSY